MTDDEVKIYFRSWRLSEECPWHVVDQYLLENGRRARGGMGAMSKKYNKGKQHKDTSDQAVAVFIKNHAVRSACLRALRSVLSIFLFMEMCFCI